jgi:hypothetical protein
VSLSSSSGVRLGAGSRAARRPRRPFRLSQLSLSSSSGVLLLRAVEPWHLVDRECGRW